MNRATKIGVFRAACALAAAVAAGALVAPEEPVDEATTLSEQAALNVNELGGGNLITEAIFRGADKRERITGIFAAEFQC